MRLLRWGVGDELRLLYLAKARKKRLESLWKAGHGRLLQQNEISAVAVTFDIQTHKSFMPV